MKKLAVLIVSLLALVSCAKNDTPFNGSIVDGLYVYYGQTYNICIGTTYKDGFSAATNCQPGYITISDNSGAYLFNQIQDIETIQQGGYYGWRYENGLALICVPVSEKEFIAKVLANTSAFSLPGEMKFSFLK